MDAKKRLMRWFCSWSVLLCIVSCGGVLWASKPPKPGELAKWSFLDGDFVLWVGGQYRARMEFMQRRDLRPPDAVAGALEDNLFVTHRARLTVGATVWKNVDMMIQVQDVRLWGEMTDTLFDYQAKGFDVHQAWARFHFGGDVSLKVGRTEINYDTDRIMGAVDWMQQARSFDGLVMAWEPGWMRLHAFYAVTLQRDTMLHGTHFTGAWAKLQKWSFFAPSFLYVMDMDVEAGRYRHTVGTHIEGKVGGFHYTGEFYYQGGVMKREQETMPIQAFLAALMVGYTLPVATKPTLRLWAEFLSGNHDTNEKVVRAFDTLFATNHKFYGYLDMFLNIPVHTRQRGLTDFGGSLGFSPFAGFSATAMLHYFRLFAPAPDAQQQLQQELGWELDIVFSYQFLRGFASISGGYSILLPQSGFSVLGKGQTPEHWFFLQCEAKF